MNKLYLDIDVLPITTVSYALINKQHAAISSNVALGWLRQEEPVQTV